MIFLKYNNIKTYIDSMMIGKSTIDTIFREEVPEAGSISDMPIGKLPLNSNLVVYSEKITGWQR